MTVDFLCHLKKIVNFSHHLGSHFVSHTDLHLIEHLSQAVNSDLLQKLVQEQIFYLNLELLCNFCRINVESYE